MNTVAIWARRFRNRHPWWFNIRMAWQRARHQSSDDQLWSLNHSSAQLIVAGVRQMRECAIGYPMEFSSDYGSGG